ncbi:MAG: TRAP transporter substrate-binding protein [Alphaproteobacteria bacterium]|nr:TRAP transporter substrate-binding protein [Alphaproteobacteria bacterium]
MVNRFAEEIEKRTNGRIKGKVFPAGQLGSIPRQVEGIQLGTQEAFLTPPGFLQGVNEAVQVTDAPGLSESIMHGHNTITDPEFRTPFMTLMERANILGISLFASAFNSIASRDPIRTLNDLNGKKIRVLATRTEQEIARRLNFAGVPMSFTEVLAALQQGTLDGALSAHTVMATSKFQTVTKYVTDLGAAFIFSVFYVHKPWFDKLSPADRAIVTALGFELQLPTTQEAIRCGEEAWGIWKKDGAEVIKISAADRAEMMRRIKPIGDEVLLTNPKTKDMYELVKRVAERHRPKS